jgi:hypothetical protein
MTTLRKSNECLHGIQNTVVGRLFSEMEQELFVLEKEAEEAKKKVWCMEYRIGELHRLLDDAILTISDSYRNQHLPLKIKPGAWSRSGN